MRAKACKKLALRAAKTKSHASATLAPAPAAIPFTAAITGLGMVVMSLMSGL